MTDTTDQPVILEARDLNVFYGEKQAIHSVSMSVKKGTVAALIGPSGCGKSTFLRSLNRMNDFVSTARVEGNVFYNNQNLYSKKIDPVEIRAQIGMVFQKPNPFPKTIYKNIIWGPKINGFTGDLDMLVEKSLKRAALWNEVKDRLNDSAFDLSGGQQQRLCIARTIAMNPDVILMDEPCSALDPKSTQAIEDLISELKRRYTIIIVTHNMQQAGRISDETYFFHEGRLIESGDTKQIFTKPKVRMTEDYITGRFG